MKIGVCAWSFSDAHHRAGVRPDPHQPEDLLQMALEYDLAAVEVAADSLRSFGASDATRFMAKAQENNVVIVADTGGCEAPDEIGDRVAEAVAVAAPFGVRTIRTTISRCLEGDRSRFGYRGWKDHLGALVEPLARAAKLAGESGISIGVENHQDICSEELVWLCEAVGSPHFGVVMDIGNAFAVGEHPAGFATRIMPFLKHVHLKDYMAHASPSGWRLVRCALGEGVVDFVDVLPRITAGAPGVLGCIELGASNARHIRLLDRDWWTTYDERPFTSVVDAIRALHSAEPRRDLDWQTPRERGEPMDVVAGYEMDQFRRSVGFLKEIA